MTCHMGPSVSDLKYHQKSNFAQCRHIANAYDPHRLRDVKLYHIPGDFTVVGVSDGVDTWIAPTACNPFSVDVVRLYERIRNGEILEAPNQVRKRIVVALPQLAPTPTTTRTRIHVNPLV